MLYFFIISVLLITTVIVLIYFFYKKEKATIITTVYMCINALIIIFLTFVFYCNIHVVSNYTHHYILPKAYIHTLLSLLFTIVYNCNC